MTLCLLVCVALQSPGLPISLGDPFGDAISQEETGFPLIPFAGLEAGVAYARFDDDLGFDDDSDSGWFASLTVGGAHVDGVWDARLRLTYRHFDQIEVEEAEGINVSGTDAEARMRGGIVDVSVDRGFGIVRVGATLGGGAYRLTHRFERDTAWTGEAGIYVRVRPFSLLAIEAGATAAGMRVRFNDDDGRIEPLYLGYATVTFELRF